MSYKESACTCAQCAGAIDDLDSVYCQECFDSDRQDAEAKIEALENEIEDLEANVEDLEKEIEDLKSAANEEAVEDKEENVVE